jgi:hypothetical protein
VSAAMVAARGYALAIKAVEHRALNCHGTPYGTLMGTTNGRSPAPYPKRQLH